MRMMGQGCGPATFMGTPMAEVLLMICNILTAVKLHFDQEHAELRKVL